MTLVTDLNTLNPEARKAMGTVLESLSSITKNGKKHVSLRPAVFGHYVANAMLDNIQPLHGCAAVMDVLFDMGEISYFMPGDWERIHFPKVMDLTRDEAMCEQAKFTGRGSLFKGSHVLRLEGFYTVYGVKNCIVRCYRTLNRMGSYKTLAEMPKDEMMQVAFNGSSLSMSAPLERQLSRRALRGKPQLALVPKVALSA